MLVGQFLEFSARRFPDKTALIFNNQRWTYRQLEETANALGNGLLALGLEKGDRVIVFLENSLECVVSIFAILKAGGVFSVVNSTTKRGKLLYILNDCRARILISHLRKQEMVASLIDRVPSLKAVVLCGGISSNLPKKCVSWDDLVGTYPSSSPPAKCIDIDLANIIYTSGTTGEPKGVMMTHQNMDAAASSIIEYLENRSSDIILNVLPLSFDYGLYQVLMSFKFGGTLVLERSFLYPYSIVQTLIREKVTGFPVVPTIAAILLQLDDLKNHDFRHLRYLSNTAAPLPVSHIKKLREVFPYAKVYSMYGLTECKRTSYLPPEQLDIRPTSVGKGMPNVEVYIVNSLGERIARPGEVGELVVRGANVMKGYWEKPEETERVLKQGKYPWEKVLYTGDLFKMDDEGYLYFVARKDDIIKCRGEKVSPREVENVLYSLEGVLEAAVIGVPDGVLGEAIKAFIAKEKDSSLTEKQVLRYCAQNLEDFMVPKYVEFRPSLPKTTSGKIRKKDLL